MGLAHWDDVEHHRRAKGEMDATWQRLGEAAGTKGVGLNRVRVAPGKLPTPPHSHGASEEVYYVLAGSGLAWQDEQVHEVRPGDCVIHRANELEHTFVAGPDGLEYLVYGTTAPDRARLAASLGRRPVRLAVGRGARPTTRGTARPRRRRSLRRAGASGRRTSSTSTRSSSSAAASMNSAPLATHERSDQAGFHWERLDPGGRGSPPHCHSEEEEIFVILEGDGTLELWPSPLSAARGAEREDIPIRAGHVIARPPGRASATRSVPARTG